MTTPSGTELTDDQLNAMVAEVVGWKRRIVSSWDGRFRWNGPLPHQQDTTPPEYTTSRDACATFEATLDGAERVRYSDLVCDLTTSSPYDDLFDCLTATPRQRCIAFLRMKGVL